MRKLMISAFLVVFLLSGCLPSLDQQDEVVQENNENTKEKAIVPKYQISDSYYRTLTPFEPSGSRGTVVSNLNTRFDSDEMEEGLLRLSQNSFSTETYIFQEGQYLDKETVTEWLKRKTDDADSLGLNPKLEADTQEGHEQNPIYLASILEHNYLVKSDDNTVKLGGISIGLALNSVYSYSIYDEKGNRTNYEYKISDKKLLEQGKKIAEQVISRLRNIEGLEEIPITIGLFKGKAETSVLPGNYVAYSTATKGTSLEWNDVKEKYVLFPSSEASKNYIDDWNKFDLFQNDVSDYFPNYNGIVGTAFYVNDELNKLSVEINMQFYGKSEVIGFSQYIAGLIVNYFEEHWVVEVKVMSANGQEALILKEPDMDEPFVHIY
ncbi:CamS family sex pheromone protein [Caldibacillus lycopersici]|uniref:CamS family sex pheromone protein n=1 Tax=Perspicuibacillus lycopersici TaxID=1325689 RepID=A0AAE3LTP3_9BACI|nr:CamS family sex pheromone protein [Perspicuibacillus lycopersici]